MKKIWVVLLLAVILVACSKDADDSIKLSSEEELLEIAKEVKGKYKELITETDSSKYNVLRKELFVNYDNYASMSKYDPYTDYRVVYSNERVSNLGDVFSHEYHVKETYTTKSGKSGTFSGTVYMEIVRESNGNYKIAVMRTDGTEKQIGEDVSDATEEESENTTQDIMEKLRLKGNLAVNKILYANIAENEEEFQKAFSDFKDPDKQIENLRDKFFPGKYVNVEPTIENESIEQMDNGFVYEADVITAAYMEDDEGIRFEEYWKLVFELNNGDYQITKFEIHENGLKNAAEENTDN